MINCFLGYLHLSLTKDTYECLGIQGKPSPFKNDLKFGKKLWGTFVDWIIKF